ncbi:MAG TPA: AEC family transporter [Candidatus Limnocylindria bacterium]|nr:AEC family transporter [Candidatus Limnocylindria bacterium]
MGLLLAVSAVFPILFYMAVGALLNHRGRVSMPAVNQFNYIIFKYCFPFVMFHSIYRADLASASAPSFVGVMAALLFLLAGVSWFILRRVNPDRRALGSMMQGIVRGNALLFAFPVVEAVSGRNNTGLASLVVATVIPVANVLAVVILETLRGQRFSLPRLLASILRNPIVVGALAAVPFKAFGIVLPGFMEKVVADVAGLVTPVALVLLGAGLRLADTRLYRKELVSVGALRLVLAPLLNVLVVRALGFGPVATTTAMAFGAVPTAVSTYVMAREMDADAALAGQIVAATTVASVATMFLWVLALTSLGWIGPA